MSPEVEAIARWLRSLPPGQDVRELANEIEATSSKHRDDVRERLRTIVDEGIGIQPVLGFEELLDLVEKKLAEDRRIRIILREAVHQLHLLVPPARLADVKSPCVLEAIAMVTS